jgi:hypothetical protein
MSSSPATFKTVKKKFNDAGIDLHILCFNQRMNATDDPRGCRSLSSGAEPSGAREPTHPIIIAVVAGDRRDPAKTAIGRDAELLLPRSGLTFTTGPMRTVNRSAVVVIPKQPFLDWLHRVDSSSGKLTLTDLGDDPSIYLLPECDVKDELEECFKVVCVEIFEDQLDGWYRAQDRWPEDRSLEIFQLWFDYRLHSVLFDLAEEPLVAEDL